MISLFMQDEMNVSPKKTSPKPASTRHQLFALSLWQSIEPKIPAKASAIAYGPILESPAAIRIVVIVVPIFAPMMIAVAWLKHIMPALTKPMTITVVAALDCMSVVAPAPIPTPASLLFEVRSNNFLKPLFATL